MTFYQFIKIRPQKFISWHTPTDPTQPTSASKFPHSDGFKQGWYLYIENADPKSGNIAVALIEWENEDQGKKFIKDELPQYSTASDVVGEPEHPDIPQENTIRIQLDFNFSEKKVVDIQVMSPGT